MLTRIFILLVIAFLGSLIWWPGLYDLAHFEALTQTEISRSETLFSQLKGYFPFNALSFSELRSGVSDKVDTFLGADIFPSNPSVDLEHESSFKDAFGRMLASPYFLAARSLIEMAALRGVIAFIWFAALMPLLIVVCFDAWMVRRLKYESFAAHNPVLYQFALSAPYLLIGLALTVFLLPFELSTALATVFYILFLASLHLLISHFHRFG